MAQEVKNFGRFFALLKKMPYEVEEDERHSMVVLATSGRTNSLREMTQAEYDEMCFQLEGRYRRGTMNLRYRRSCALALLTDLGIGVRDGGGTDWQRVNAFCRNARIAGKDFYLLTEAELRELERKLRSILRKGGIKK